MLLLFTDPNTIGLTTNANYIKIQIKSITKTKAKIINFTI